jgi:hypothetical protein
MGWIRIENRIDAALFILIFKMSLLNSDQHRSSPLNSYDEIRLIVHFEMNSSNNFVENQSILFAPIRNNKRLDNSYRSCYQSVDFIMILFVIIYTPVLI